MVAIDETLGSAGVVLDIVVGGVDVVSAWRVVVAVGGCWCWRCMCVCFVCFVGVCCSDLM